MTKRPKPILLTVMDGWGFRAETKGNAIALARKPAYDELMKKFPNTLIHTSGPFVGLPEGQMGNSEVGHMNMGAGRIVHMDTTRIDLLIANRQLQNVPLFQQAMERGRTRQLHLVGLLSDGGVHSHIQHLFALLEMARQQKVENVFVHCFMDGRDTPPNSGRDYVRQLQQKMRELGVGEIATLVGRYYAMDRDNRWERVELAYRALVHGETETRTEDPVAALQKSYEQGITDEFVKPIVVTKGKGDAASPVGLIRDGDAVQEFAHGGDREVRARDLFFQWRSGEAVCRGRADTGAIPKSCDLRFEARDVRGGNHGYGGEGHREGRVRRHHHELRECGHGGSFGKTGSGDQGGGSGGRRTRADLPGFEIAGRRVDYHRRPRECRDDDRSRDRRAAYVSHHQSGAVHSGERRRKGALAARWLAA